jgi:hypothetical protein
MHIFFALKLLLKEIKNVFSWTYKDLKDIPPKWHNKKNKIVPPTHQTQYQSNLNYAIIAKQDINKLLATRFI